MAKNKWTELVGTLGRIALDIFVDSRKSDSAGSGSRNSGSGSGSRNSGSDSRSRSKKSDKGSKKTTKPSPAKVPGAAKAPGASASTKNSAKPTSTTQPPPQRASATPPLSDRYPGDFTATVAPEYSPAMDGDADPGEVVWTWIPYEDDFNQGKDRPTLIVGRDGDWLLGLMLTSKDKSKSRYGDWLDIGSGPWDNQGRDSEIRLDRVVRVHPEHMRREGAIMDRATFMDVVKAMAAARR